MNTSASQNHPVWLLPLLSGLAVTAIALFSFLLGQAYLGQIIAGIGGREFLDSFLNFNRTYYNLGVFYSLFGIFLLWVCAVHRFRLSWSIGLACLAIIPLSFFLIHQCATAGWVGAQNTPLLAGMFTLLFLVLHQPWKKRTTPENDYVPLQIPVRFFWALVWVVVISVLAFLIVGYVKKHLVLLDELTITVQFFPLRDGLHDMFNIASTPFTEWGRLWFPAAFLLLVLFVYKKLLDLESRLKPWVAVLVIYILGNLGTLSVLYVGSEGLNILTEQLNSYYCTFFLFAKQYASLSDIGKMVAHYAEDINTFYVFARTHPPFLIVLNWICLKVAFGSDVVAGLLLCALAWTAVFPVYYIGKTLYNKEFGLYMAMLYSVMPPTLMYNHANHDALIATLMAWCFALTLKGSRSSRHGYMFWAGITAALFAATTYILPLFLVGLFWVSLMGLRDQQLSVGTWIKYALLKTLYFVGAILLLWGLVELATRGQFDYFKMMKSTFAYNQTMFHLTAWYLWFGLAWVQYFIYLGIPITVLLFIRLKELFTGHWRNDYFPWVGLLLILIPFVNGTIRSETDRFLQVFNVFVLAAAALSLRKGTPRLQYMSHPADSAEVPAQATGLRWALLLFVGLTYVQTVVMQLLVIDKW